MEPVKQLFRPFQNFQIRNRIINQYEKRLTAGTVWTNCVGFSENPDSCGLLAASGPQYICKKIGLCADKSVGFGRLKFQQNYWDN